jgi:flagellar hook protein FlgE
MTLYGALFGGVSGLGAQGSKIAVVSDNIANVNTVGYKEVEATFETLVINSSTKGAYQTGGVRGGSRTSVDAQGLLLSTNVATDIAMSGEGMFVVNANPDGSGKTLYTRAGSFRQDSSGNFVNANGFYLQGWPLDPDGRLPGEFGNLNTASSANLDSLETVNIESANGVAQGTTQIDIVANLDAEEDIYPGEGGTVTLDILSPENYGIASDDIIVPDESSYLGALADTNGIMRGDQFRVTTGSGLNYDYEYGGFTVGRDVDNGNGGDGLQDISRLHTVTAATDASVAAGSNVVTLNVPGHGLVDGDEITVAGLDVFDPGTGNIDINGTYHVTVVDGNTLQITYSGTPWAAGGNIANAGTPTTIDYDPYDGGIFDADNANEVFFGQVTGGTGRFTEAALSFTITRSSGDTHTFTYTTSPNTTNGEFNSLSTLATAIDDVHGLTARVVNGRLFISGEDANESLTFNNGDALGDMDGEKTGIDWVSELGLQNVAAGDRRFNSMAGLADIVNGDEGVAAVISDPLNESSMEIRVSDPQDTIEFSDVGNAPFTISAGGSFEVTAGNAVVAGNDLVLTIDLGVAASSLDLAIGSNIIIQNQTAIAGMPGILPNTPGVITDGVLTYQGWEITGNPAANIIEITIPGRYVTADVAAFGPTAGDSSAAISIYGESNQGSLLAEFGLVPSLNSVEYADPTTGPQSTGVLGPEYDPSGTVGSNMASGEITPHFSRSTRIYDALGTGHDISFSYIKVDQNEWAVEIFATPADDIITSAPDGQIASGTIRFNGDGSLREVSTSLSRELSIVWANEASPSAITIDWGTAGQPFGTTGALAIGLHDGLTQSSTDYFADVDQNGASVSQLVSVEIDADGYVIATYESGETRAFYQIPIADFRNFNGLQQVTGNVFAQTRESGEVNLRQAGSNGVGTVVSGSLEQSNVELSEQLTDLIVAQRAYQANTRVISTSDELLEQLNNL